MPPRSVGRLAEIAGYAGGSLLLGAVALFLGNGWHDLSEGSRVMILVCTALLMLVIGALIAMAGDSVRSLGRTHDSARRRLVSVLWTFAAATAAGAAGLAVDHYELAAASATGLVVAGVCYALVPSAVGLFGSWAASIGLLCGLIAEIGDYPDTTPYALVLLALGALWVVLARTKVLREQEVGLALGAGLALVAAQLPVISYEADELGYALTAVVAAVGFAGYLSDPQLVGARRRGGGDDPRGARGAARLDRRLPARRRLAADRRADAARRPARSVCGCAAASAEACAVSEQP